ncbi:MAG: DNA repair protein RadA/Sms [Phycisphaerales bacterium]|jgi:DNA repair protein RadA/Sms
MGKCPDCGAWDSLEETKLDSSATRDPQKGLVEGWIGQEGSASAAVAVPIAQVQPSAGMSERLPSGITEFDRVLGGTDRSRGLVRGSAVLFGGEPGIGKSTLLLQAAGAWAQNVTPRPQQPDWGGRVLYVSSEESAEQVRLRARRLGVADLESLYVLADTNLARIVEQARQLKPDVLIIDSIQMIYKADLDAAPGSITQLRRCSSELVYLAKASGTAVVLVGHVTKDGTLAGPRLLEHLVDTVLYFEGDRHHAGRIVRAIKNRFGTTLELGLFEMTGTGLVERAEGAGAAATNESRPGSVVCPAMHGNRCVLAELQALTATGFLGNAKRKASGIDSSRLAMLIAVLEQHSELRLADRDIFVSSVGGIRVVEPAADLALALAIAGAHFRRALEPGVCAIGEIGLGGEIRSVTQLEQRLREASRLGFSRAIVPPGSRQAVGGGTDGEAVQNGAKKADEIDLIEAKNLDRAIELLG